MLLDEIVFFVGLQTVVKKSSRQKRRVKNGRKVGRKEKRREDKKRVNRKE